MLYRGEVVDGFTKETIKFNSEVKVTPSEAREWLCDISQKAKTKEILHYNQIVINERINLWFPGKYDEAYPGDYLLTWDGEPPTHREVCDAIVRNISSESGEILIKCRKWIKLLDEVFENGTKNVDMVQNQKDKFATQLIFWVTLQEDIHHKDKGGRRIPLCRYAEAINTSLKNFDYSYDEVIERLDSTSPETLEQWDLPLLPKFYKWSAF